MSGAPAYWCSQRLAELAGAVEVAAHVVADADVDADGRLEAEMRVKAGDGVDVFDGDAAAGGDAVDFFGGDVADVLLHVAQVFEDAELVAAGFDLDEDFGRGVMRLTRSSRAEACGWPIGDLRKM